MAVIRLFRYKFAVVDIHQLRTFPPLVSRVTTVHRGQLNLSLAILEVNNEINCETAGMTAEVGQ